MCEKTNIVYLHCTIRYCERVKMESFIEELMLSFKCEP